VRCRKWSGGYGQYLEWATGERTLIPLADGSLDRFQPKAGFWKCPYHNSRMCLQTLHIFE